MGGTWCKDNAFTNILQIKNLRKFGALAGLGIVKLFNQNGKYSKDSFYFDAMQIYFELFLYKIIF